MLPILRRRAAAEGVYEAPHPSGRWAICATRVIAQVALPKACESRHAGIAKVLRSVVPVESYLPYRPLVSAKLLLAGMSWEGPDEEGEVLAALALAQHEFFSPTPLWYLHGRAYDLSAFDHPGGREWISLSGGRDVTVLFESHHIRIELARRRLAAFLVPDVAVTHPSDTYDWADEGFYATLRRRVGEALLQDAGAWPSTSPGPATVAAAKSAAVAAVAAATAAAPLEDWLRASGPTVGLRATRAAAVLAYLASYGATVWSRSPLAAAGFGAMTAVLGGFGHGGLHGRGQRWDARLFEATGMSPTVYRVEHVFAHHGAPNSDRDPDARTLEPLITYEPPAPTARAAALSPSLPQSWSSSPLSSSSSSSSSSPSSSSPSSSLCHHSGGAAFGGATRAWPLVRLLSPLYCHAVAGCLSLVMFLANAGLALGLACGRASRLLGLRPRVVCKTSASEAAFETFDGAVPLAALAGLVVTSPCVGLAPACTDGFALWALASAVGSGYFMLVTTVSHNQPQCWQGGQEDDWGKRQLAVSMDIAVPGFFGGERRRGLSVVSMWFFWLHQQSLHHLFPGLDQSRLEAIRPVVRDTCAEFNVPFRPPLPYHQLYLGMLRVLSGAHQSGGGSGTGSGCGGGGNSGSTAGGPTKAQ